MAHDRKTWLGRTALAVTVLVALNGLLLFSFPQERTALFAAWEDVRKRKTPGFSCRTYVDEAGVAHNYAVFVPYVRPSGPRPPVILYLNGLGQNGDDGISPLANGLAPAIWDRRSDFPFVVIFAQCAREDVWESATPSGRRALAILDKTVSECDADPDRICVTGISAGGTGAWRLATGDPERFAAVVPISALPPSDAIEKIAAARLPVWSFYVRGDATSLVRANDAAHRSLLHLQGITRLTTLDGTRSEIIDHHDAWDFAFRDLGLYAWLLSQNAGSRSAAGPVLVAFDAQPPNPGDPPHAWTMAGEELVGQAVAGGEDKDNEFFAGTVGRDWELHVEFRVPAEGRWEIEFRPVAGAVTPAGVRLELATSDVGGCGIFDAGTGRSLGLTAPAAQRAIAIGAGDWNDVLIRVSDDRAEAWQRPAVARYHRPCGSKRRLRSLLPHPRRSEQADRMEASPVLGKRPRTLEIEELLMAAVICRVMLMFVAPTTAEPTVSSRDQVISAWRERQAATSSIRFSWTRDDGRKDSRSAIVGGLVVVDGESRFWTDHRNDGSGGDQFGENGYRGSPAFRQVLDSRFRSPSKLGSSCRFERATHDLETLEFTDEGDGRIRGRLRAPAEIDFGVASAESLADRPLALIYRPFGKFGFSVRPESCTVAPQRSMIDGAACLVLDERRRISGTDVRRRYWVDPARGFVVRRAVVSRDGRDDYQIDVRYSNDSTHGWVPAWWHVMTFPDGPERFPGQRRLFQGAAFSVKDYTINGSISPQAADVRIPEGAVIADELSGRSFVAMQDGSRRYLSETEVVAMSFSGQKSKKSTWTLNARYWVSGGVVAAAVALLWRRRRRRVAETFSDGRSHVC